MKTQAMVSDVASYGGIPDAEPNRSKPSFKIQILQIIAISLLATLSYLVVSRYFVQSVEVVGASMYPTLHDSDRYLLNRWTYHLHQPKRGDIVVVRDPTDGTFVVKRIVAMPGESILFKNGDVLVNGHHISEPYVAPGKHTYLYSSVQEQMTVCGSNQYFVLGDNRDNSFDSRMYGPVRRENILGVVMR